MVFVVGKPNQLHESRKILVERRTSVTLGSEEEALVITRKYRDTSKNYDQGYL